MFEIIVVILLLFIAIEIKLYKNKKYLKTTHSIVLLIFVWEKKNDCGEKKKIIKNNYHAFSIIIVYLWNIVHFNIRLPLTKTKF